MRCFCGTEFKPRDTRSRYCSKDCRIIRNANQQRITNYDKLYGITIEEYNDLFIRQKGCCAICNVHQHELKKKMFVDHCHTSGKVRGLLCNKCNVGLGQFNDSIELLNKGIKYLDGRNNS